MKPEDRLFTYLVIAVCLGLVVAGAVLYLTPRDSAPFSSVQFLEPDELPHIVRVNSEHGFDYEIMSFEHELMQYNVTSTLELYRLYDTTEGLYNCLSPYRKKFFMRWTNETPTQYVQEAHKGYVQDLVVKQSKELLNWSEINLYFTLGQTFATGDFVIYYGPYNSTPDFTIRINSYEGNIYFNEVYQGKINVSKQNDKVRLTYKDGFVSFVHNGEVLFKEESEISPGQFGFESRNALFSLSNMIVSKFHPIEVPDRGNVINYEFDTNRYFQVFYEARGKLSSSYNFIRQYADDVRESADACNGFACSHIQPIERAVEDFYHDNITHLIKDLPWDGISYPFWHIAQTEVENPWYSFNITGIRPVLPARGSITMLFDNDFGIMVTNASISVMYVDEELYILQYPLTNTTFEVRIDYDFIEVQTDNGPKTLSIPFHLRNKTIQLYTLNSIQTVEEITLSKTDCEPYTFCDIFVLPIVPRSISNTNEEAYGETVVVEPSLPTHPIPTTKASFSGTNAFVNDSANFSLQLSAKYLDGKGLVHIFFTDNEDKVVFNVTHDILNSLFHIGNESVWVNTSIDSWRRIRVDYRENLTVYFNQTQVYTHNHSGNISGFFSVETQDSHLEMTNLQLKKGRKTIRLPLLEDPCRLRPVYTEVLREESFNLTPQTSKSFTDSFAIERFFDYGKVSIDLDGSSGMNNTPLQVHYWLVRE